MNRRMIATLRLNAHALPKLAAFLMVLLACFAISAPAHARVNEPERAATATKPAAKTSKPAKKGKPAPYGEVQVTTPTGKYEYLLDGNQACCTSPEGIVLSPLTKGRHTLEILMENDTRWTRDIYVTEGHRYCIGVTHKESPRHCWDYPLTAKIASASKNDDTYTLTSQVDYKGDIEPVYLWTFSSDKVTFISGDRTSRDITISTAGASGIVKVSLFVSVDDGSGNPSCKREDYKELCISTNVIPDVKVDKPHFRKGDKLTFTPDVKYDGERGLNYIWTTEPQLPFTENPDHSITVDTTTLVPRTVRALLTVRESGSGADTGECKPVEAPASAEASFDEIGDIKTNDLKARLDNFVIEVNNRPSTKALVYVHGPLKEAQTIVSQVRDYLINSRSLSRNRVQVEPIADSDKIHIELWPWEQGSPRPPTNLGSVTSLEQPRGIQHIPGYQRRTPARRRSNRR